MQPVAVARRAQLSSYARRRLPDPDDHPGYAIGIHQSDQGVDDKTAAAKGGAALNGRPTSQVKIVNVTYRRIRSQGLFGGSFRCQPGELACSGIRLEDVRLNVSRGGCSFVNTFGENSGEIEPVSCRVPGMKMDDSASGCTSSTPLVWVSTAVVANETALLVTTTSPETVAAKTVQAMTHARLCPRTEPQAGGGGDCSFVKLREQAGEDDPPSAPRKRSVSACAFTIPATAAVQTWDVSLCSSADTESCSSVSRPLSAPEVVWAQGDRGNSSEAGSGWLRLFGRALFFARRPGPFAQSQPLRCVPEREGHVQRASLPKVRARQGSSAWTSLTVTAASCYSISAKVPSSFAGAYKLSVNNGLPGSPWADVDETLTVVAKRSWPTETFDVVEHGSVWNALAAARNNSGGVVHFPRGTYTFDENHTLDDIPANTVLRGEAAGLVSLHWADMEAPPPALITGKDGRWMLTNITVHVQLNFKSIIWDQGQADVRIIGVRIRSDPDYYLMPGPDPFFRDRNSTCGNSYKQGSAFTMIGKNFEISGCDVFHGGQHLLSIDPHGPRAGSDGPSYGYVHNNSLAYGFRCCKTVILSLNICRAYVSPT